mmetsp:Transcript_34026/g.42926  ORF Transcript_34026/g.42926 Transcript_34026/m.42926 type:complete len:207 (+) Transcript_34026:582-1202(+)
MSLNCKSFNCQFFATNNFEDVKFVLGSCTSFKERSRRDSGAFCSFVQLLHLEQSIFCLLVARTHWSSTNLRNTSVKRSLPSLKSSSDTAARTRVLSSHTKTTRSTLSSRDTSSLAFFVLSGAWCRFEVVYCKFNTSICCYRDFSSSFPVKKLHRKCILADSSLYCHLLPIKGAWHKSNCCTKKSNEEGQYDLHFLNPEEQSAFYVI